MTKNDMKYYEMCNLLYEYVNSVFDYPKSLTEFKGKKLGEWLRHQVMLFNNNSLSPERINILNRAFQAWNGTKSEKESCILELFIYHWNNEIKSTIKGIPVDVILKDFDLVVAYRNNIRTIDDLICDYFKIPSVFRYKNCLEDALSYKYPNIDFKYFKLLNAIFCVNIHKCSYEHIDYLDFLTFKNTTEMDERFEKIIKKLSDKQRIVIENKYMKDNISYDELSNLLGGITNAHIIQIKNAALRKLRSELAHYDLMPNSIEIANMQKSGITPSQFQFLRDNSMLSEHYSELVTEWLDNGILESLDLSTRAYNCLRRAGINNIKEAVTVFEKLDDVKRIHMLGNKCAKEIYEKLLIIYPNNEKLRKNLSKINK